MDDLWSQDVFPWSALLSGQQPFSRSNCWPIHWKRQIFQKVLDIFMGYGERS
jgi:hypothetical protein